MTVSTTSNKVTYDGNGSTIEFAVPFYFLADNDIEVILRAADGAETVWSEDTQYTLWGAGLPGGGTLTVATAPTDYTPQSGEKLLIRRVEQYTQPIDLPVAGAFPSASIEQALDRLTMLAQQLKETIDRSLVLSATSSYSGLSLPDPSANGLLGWSSGADALENKNVLDFSGQAAISGFMETLLDDSDAATARNTLGLGSAAVEDVGTGANEVVQLDGSARLPAVDGSQLTNVNGFKTGDMVFSFRKSPEPGRIFVDGSTIGSSGSGANYTGTDYNALFEFFWNNLGNTYAPVSGGRGSSAATDWSAGKRITMPNMRRRVPVMADDTAPARVLGETGGEEEHQLTIAEIPSHTHNVQSYQNSDNCGFIAATACAVSSQIHPTYATGGDQAHNNMQPYIVGNWEVQI